MSTNFKKFPRVGEPWVECDICGFDFPKSQVRRDRRGRIVDAKCMDEKDHGEHMEDIQIPEEKGFGDPIEGEER
jgi:hypothetical protein